MNIKQTISKNLLNIPGWRTNKKIVVIESDDWGSIRMPSKDVYSLLKKKGIPVDKSPYCKYDSLESNDDLESLFNVLTSYKDFKGNHPVITANTVVANPDFDKIKESNYQEYFYEPFTETLKRYPNHDNVYNLYKQGINDAIFFPQFHGREHVNIEMWLQLIQTNSDFKLAFDNRMWGLSTDVLDTKKNIQATYDSTNIKLMKESIVSGLALFEKIFGYKSKTFIANNFIWDVSLDKTLADNGVKCLQGMKYQKLPKTGSNPNKLIRHHLGEINIYNQVYSIRNCYFEPSSLKKGYRDTLKEIETSFFWKKPAIISSHRLNFVGTLSEKNRETNIIGFKFLIESILHKWPDVEFMNSAELSFLINN